MDLLLLDDPVAGFPKAHQLTRLHPPPEPPRPDPPVPAAAGDAVLPRPPEPDPTQVGSSPLSLDIQELVSV